MMNARLSPWPLTLAIAAIGLALAAQQLTMANSSALMGWLLFVCSAVLIVFAAPPQSSSDAAEGVRGASDQGITPRPHRLWAIASSVAVIVAISATTVLSSRNLFAIAAVMLWMVACSCGAVALAGRRVTMPVRGATRW